MRDIVFATIPIRFPLKPNENGICFSKEAINNLKGYENAPIIQDNKAIGIIKDIESIKDEENEIIVDFKSYLYVECLPEIIVKESEGNIIKSFEFLAINIK